MSGNRKEGEFLVFVIELQVHKLWQFWRWYPTVKAMTAMLVELLEHPEFGLLHYEYRFSFNRQFILMYWRSFEHMHDWATSKDTAHADGWRMLNKLMKKHPELLGFWHESFVVTQYGSFYRNVPEVGLGRAGTLVPLSKYARTFGATPTHTRRGDRGDRRLGSTRARRRSRAGGCLRNFRRNRPLPSISSKAVRRCE